MDATKAVSEGITGLPPADQEKIMRTMCPGTYYVPPKKPKPEEKEIENEENNPLV